MDTGASWFIGAGGRKWSNSLPRASISSVKQEHRHLPQVRDEMGTQGFEKKVWNGHFRDWKVSRQEDSGVPKGWKWFEILWQWQERLLSWGLFFSRALLPRRTCEEGILLSSSRIIVFPQASLMKGQNRSVGLGYWQNRGWHNGPWHLTWLQRQTKTEWIDR